VTPSEKLDYLLAVETVTPRISQVVNVSRYKYVYASHQAIRIGDYVINIPYGMLSDGSSCVPDRVPAAWWAHDRLYLSPWAMYKNVRVRISKRKSDMIYARIGLKHANPIVFLEGCILATGINRRVWKRYRKRDEEKLLQLHTVPKATQWHFPTQFTREATWIGPDALILNIPDK